MTLAASLLGWTPAVRIGSALASLLVTERERWALWLPVLIGAGVAVYFALPVEPAWRWGMAAVALSFAAVWLSRLHAVLRLLAIALCAVALGFAAAQLRTALVAAPILESRLGPVAVTGTVLRVEERVTDRRLVLGDLTIDRLKPDETPARIRLTHRAGGPEVVPGDRVRLRATILPPPSPAAPGAFDFARQAYFEQIGGVGFTLGPALIETGARDTGWQARLARLRHRITERIADTIKGAAGGIATSLITGERGAIPERDLDAMRDSGLAHLLSISGLHMSLVAGIAFFMLRLLLALIEPMALRFPIKKWAAFGALVAIFLYLLISGMSVPAQRSFLMAGAVLVAVMADRSPFSMRLVAWAAAVILLLVPEALLGASFQMSFAAVVALIAAYEALARPLARWRSGAGWIGRGLFYVAGVCLTTLVAGLATTPLSAFHFNQIVSYSLLANLIAVPVTGFLVMPFAMLALILMPVGLEHLALVPMGWGVKAILWTAHWVAGLPGATVGLAAPPGWTLIAVGLGGLWLCLWTRGWRWLGLLPVAAAVIGAMLARPPDVLVDAEASRVAVRLADGHLAVLGSDRGFTVENWRRRAADSSTEKSDAVQCDSLGCTVSVAGQGIAFARQAGALAEDCRRATVLVSAEPVRGRCAAPVVIDRLDVWRGGAHSVRLTAKGPVVETAHDARGARPWVDTTGRQRRPAAPNVRP